MKCSSVSLLGSLWKLFFQLRHSSFFRCSRVVRPTEKASSRVETSLSSLRKLRAAVSSPPLFLYLSLSIAMGDIRYVRRSLRRSCRRAIARQTVDDERANQRPREKKEKTLFKALFVASFIATEMDD